VDTHPRHQHHGHHRRRRHRGQEAGGQEEAAHHFDDSGLRGMEPARPEAQLLQELAGAGKAVAAEPAQQLLRAVRGQGEADHQTQDQESDAHLNLRA
jgi:hypothetical protein